MDEHTFRTRQMLVTLHKLPKQPITQPSRSSAYSKPCGAERNNEMSEIDEKELDMMGEAPEDMEGEL
jgi:hypothetical protein